MNKIYCAGSIALDTTITPFHKAEKVLGGAAVYFSMAARLFSPVHVSGAVGEDFPQDYLSLLSQKGVETGDIEVVKGGKTFYYESEFSYDMYHRKTLKTELNVLREFKPKIPKDSKDYHFFYLATMPPDVQAETMKKLPWGMKLIDTIEFYIKEDKEGVENVFSMAYGSVLNDDEARMLANEPSLIKAGRKILELGPKFVVIKKGEHGALLFYANDVIPFPALPLEEIRDPTGAGDAFAGGLMGILAQRGSVNPTLYDLKYAVAYGNVMGSFAVEDFSINRLKELTVKEVEERFHYYSNLMRL